MDLLVPMEQYLKHGVHIGTTVKTEYMRPFIYTTRQDRLNILDVQKINERIVLAGKFLANYPPQEILVVGRRKQAQKPVRKFAEVTGAKCVAGRFVPGTLTNPWGKEYVEASVVLVADPVVDREAIMEAAIVHIPVVAIVSSHNTLNWIDLAIPGNNRGKKSLALIFWLLAREYLLNRGVIKSREEFNYSPSDFEAEG